MQIKMNACQIHVQLMQSVKILMEVLFVLVKMGLMKPEWFAKVVLVYILTLIILLT